MKKILFVAALLGLAFPGIPRAQEDDKLPKRIQIILEHDENGGLRIRKIDDDKEDEKIEQPKRRCDASTTEKAKYCEDCKKECTNDDLKDGKCAKCDKEPKEVEFCVKKYWECECENAKKIPTEPKIKECKKCSKEFKEKASKAKISGYVCPKCNKKSDKEGKCDGEKCKETNLVKNCEKSGEAPHIGKLGSIGMECPHGKPNRWQCEECKKEMMKCPHGKNRLECDECKKKFQCEHGKAKWECEECKTKLLKCEHGKNRTECEECKKKMNELIEKAKENMEKKEDK